MKFNGRNSAPIDPERYAVLLDMIKGYPDSRTRVAEIKEHFPNYLHYLDFKYKEIHGDVDSQLASDWLSIRERAKILWFCS